MISLHSILDERIFEIIDIHLLQFVQVLLMRYLVSIYVATQIINWWYMQGINSTVIHLKLSTCSSFQIERTDLTSPISLRCCWQFNALTFGYRKLTNSDCTLQTSQNPVSQSPFYNPFWSCLLNFCTLFKTLFACKIAQTRTDHTLPL